MAAYSLHSLFSGLSLSPGGICHGSRIALKHTHTGGWVRMMPAGAINAGGTPKDQPNWPGTWANWVVEDAGDGSFKLLGHWGGMHGGSSTPKKYLAIKPNGNITDGGGGKHCHFKFVFNKDEGTVLIQSAAHPDCALGFLDDMEPAKDAHNVAKVVGKKNQFKVVFEGMSNLESGAKVHFRCSKSGKNVALKPNGEIHGHGGAGKHATFEVFHNPNNGRFKFFNESGYLAIQGDELRKGGGAKWCAMHVKPVMMDDAHPHVTIRSAHADDGEKAGLGFDEGGAIRPPSKTGMGFHGQFEVLRAE